MAEYMSERELRLLRRNQRRENMSNTNEETDNLLIRDINIEAQRLNEIQRQRIQLERMRRETKEEKEQLQKRKEKEQLEKQKHKEHLDEQHIKEIIERRTQLEKEFDMWKQIARRENYGGIERPEINTDDYRLKSRSPMSYCHDEVDKLDYASERYQNEASNGNMTPKENTFITLDETGNVDKLIATTGSTDGSLKQKQHTYAKDNDSLEEEMRWLDAKLADENTQREFDNSGDRIIKQGERRRTCDNVEQTYQLEEDELIRQIEEMKLRELEMIEEIKRKERLQELKQQKAELERLRVTKELLRRNRLKKLEQEKHDLEQSLLEKESTLSTLDEELMIPDHRKARTNVRDSYVQPLIYKPSVPKFNEHQNFDEWKKEIQAMIESRIYQEDVLRHAVRNAISGNPRKVLATLKPTASTEEILDTLESNYGIIKSGESIMEDFYTAKQEKDEDVSTWSVRLESILQLAVERGHIHESKRESMLKTRFWRYLRNNDLRNATRVYYETSSSFEELRRKVRREEQEMNVTKEENIKHINTHQVDQQLQMLKDLTEKMKVMEKKITELSKEREKENIDSRKENTDYRRNQRQGFNCERRGRGYRTNTQERRQQFDRRRWRPEPRYVDRNRNQDNEHVNQQERTLNSLRL